MGELRINKVLMSNEVRQWLLWCVRAESPERTFHEKPLPNGWREEMEYMHSDEKTYEHFQHHVNGT